MAPNLALKDTTPTADGIGISVVTPALASSDPLSAPPCDGQAISANALTPSAGQACDSQLHLQQVPLCPQVQALIFKGLSDYGLARTGVAGDNLDVPATSFEAWDGTQLAGAVVVKVFWGQTHVRLLYVSPAYQGQGLGSRLMDQAANWARQQGCQFMFVETMSFQATGFYQKNGFILEMERPGYLQGASQMHLRRDL
jgi:GNAT superfamily N-acetyltransferase